MLSAVNLNDESRISAQEIDFHSSPTVECNGQVCVQLKSAARLRQRFQTSIEECLGRASRAIGAFASGGIGRAAVTNKLASERRINTVTYKPTHAGSVVAFPEASG